MPIIGITASSILKAATSYVAFAQVNVVPVIAYPWSNGFGTKYADPASYASYGYGVSFTSAGDKIAVSSSSSPYVAAYPWSNGFGSRYSIAVPAGLKVTQLALPPGKVPGLLYLVPNPLPENG